MEQKYGANHFSPLEFALSRASGSPLLLVTSPIDAVQILLFSASLIHFGAHLSRIKVKLTNPEKGPADVQTEWQDMAIIVSFLTDATNVDVHVGFLLLSLPAHFLAHASADCTKNSAPKILFPLVCMQNCSWKIEKTLNILRSLLI